MKERRAAGQKTMAESEGAEEGEAPPQVLPTPLTPQGVPLSATPGDIEAHLRAAIEYMDATCPGWNGDVLKPASDHANAQMDDPAGAGAAARADAEDAHAEMTF